MKLLRMSDARPKKHMELEERMRRLLFTTMIPMTCLMILLLIIFWHYAGQYNKLSENLAVSSEFNLRFKDDLDLEMYYIAIGSKESSELEDVLGQVEDAQAILQKLRQNTYHASGMKSLKSLESYLDNLKKRMIQLTEIKEYDKRMEFMDSNIRIITSLIMQEMQNYIYQEATELVQIESQLAGNVRLTIITMCAAILVATAILLRRSFRLTYSITKPISEILHNIKKVGKGEYKTINVVSADSVEIQELDAGTRKMAGRIEGLLENVRKEQEVQLSLIHI